MIDTLLGFKDSEERNEYLIALLVLAFFGCMLCWFVFDGDEFVASTHARLTGASPQPGIQAATPDHMHETCLTGSHNLSSASCDEDQTDTNATDSENSNTAIRQDVIQENKSLDTVVEKSTPVAPSGDLTDEDNSSQNEPVDSDNDGIADVVDACPDAAGFSADNGCPKSVSETPKPQPPVDTDNDGLADFEDLCPQSPGVQANRGCPADSDQDGLPDDQDQCPDIAGVLANGGCPVDADADGVIDDLDKCPQVAGFQNNAGCPEPTEAAADKATTVTSIATGITFETASARLTEQSKTLLDKVAQILSRYPSIKLTVEGHTDDLGDATINLKLSEQRARACVSYLSRKGIDASRMNAIGYGETRPLTANSSADARRRNRRVEFKISNQ